MDLHRLYVFLARERCEFVCIAPDGFAPAGGISELYLEHLGRCPDFLDNSSVPLAYVFQDTW
jgi:hypothetical protein